MMKNVSLKAIALNVALLGSAVANSLLGSHCPETEALKTVLRQQHISQLEKGEDFVLSVTSIDGLNRTWKVHGIQKDPNESVESILTQHRPVNLEWDRSSKNQHEIDQSWCTVQFKKAVGVGKQGFEFTDTLKLMLKAHNANSDK